MEKLYSAVILPDEGTSEKIQNWINEVVGTNSSIEIEIPLYKPHITLGKPFDGQEKYFRQNIGPWLDTQKPFDLTMDKIHSFGTGVVYLTSSNEDQIGQIRDLYYDLVSRLEETSPIKTNNGAFNPHLTLVDSVSSRNIRLITDSFYLKTILPVKFRVEKLSIQFKNLYRRWETLDEFTIGSKIN